jgi:hypothetical protein
MGYEIYTWPNDDKSSTPLDVVLSAFSAAGLPVTVETDEFGHWLVFNGSESALNLDVKDGMVKGGGMKFSGEDDPCLLDKVDGVFRGINWAVGDDEGDL